MADFILMPQMGVSEESALLAEWKVKEGDEIKEGQALFTLETGKSSFEELSKFSGTLLKILEPAGNEIGVGKPVAVIGKPGEAFDAAAPAAAPAAPAPAPEAAPAAAAPAAAPAAANAPAPGTQYILMPQMGVSEESALLSEWKVKEGDEIKEGQVLFALETGKSSFEELSKFSGTLLKILAQAGEEVAVGKPVAVIGEKGAQVVIPGAAPAAAAAAPAAAAPAAAPVAAAAPAAKTGGEVLASPRAKKLAAELGLDLKLAGATGPEGRIIERDVKALAAAAPAPAAKPAAAAPAAEVPAAKPAAAPAAAAEYEDKPITRIRKVIAENMHNSLATMAQLTLNRTFDVTAINALRKQMKASEGYGLEKVTINDFVMLAVARTLPEFPDINANFFGDKIRSFKHAQLGCAVDTPRGLMVPVLKDADKMSLREISKAVKAKAAACKDGSIAPSELSGGSFTVTNLGSMGIESFTPIINPPQTCILGVCGIQLRPRLNAAGEVEYYQAMGLSLTFDHRIVDGAPAAKFLQVLAERLENISLLLAM